ncbi:MAG: hypothetical protein M3R08_05110, partial [Bacteroidota bacterium]|nr:hypothetical protein [Bacteroidota bacterium]
MIGTIPPEGVKTQDEAGLQVEDWPSTPTDHEDYMFESDPTQARSHRTTYTHNSQGQVLVQQTPNGGVTRMLYDRLGRLRLSQNAKQAVENTYSYTKYDDLGRVIEAGQSNLTFNSITVTDLFNTTPYHTAAALLSSVPQFPGSGQYITLTTYSIPVNGVAYLDGSVQRHLINRVSHVYSDEDGLSNTLFDRIHTYYSYDPHGNVEWMIQDIPFLGRKHVAYNYDLISGRVLKVRYNEGQADEFYHRYAYDA